MSVFNKYRIEIKWAVIFSLMMMLWTAGERAVGLHSTYIDMHPIYTNLMAIPAITIYVFAMKEKRNSRTDKLLSYKLALFTGLIMTGIITLLSPIVQIIISKIITPEYFANAIRYAIENGKSTASQAHDYFNLKSYIIQGFIGSVVMGSITTAIVAFFVKKNH